MILSVTAFCLMSTMVFVSKTRAGDDYYDLLVEDNINYGVQSETIEQHWKHLAEGKFNCHYNKRQLIETDMTKYFVRNKTITCNDGTPSGYYLRRSHISSRWLVYLDGGWFCHDVETCHTRWLNTPFLMSSKHWQPIKTGLGILSTRAAENPVFHDANIVYVPYCSSDAWSGTKFPQYPGEMAFLGSLILEHVLRELVLLHRLDHASHLFLAGSSAGGTGVLINLDRAAGLLAGLAPRVRARGIVDSGWFLDNQQYRRTECTHIHSCAPTDSIRRGMQHWQGVVADACLEQYRYTEHWRCYFGYRVYPTLKTPVFVIQHLFDEAQLTVDNVGTPVRREQWQYVHALGADMRTTLSNVSAVFAPACLSHIILTRGDWLRVSVGRVTLPEALACWEAGTDHEHNLYSRRASHGAQLALAQSLITGIDVRRHKEMQGDSPAAGTEAPPGGRDTTRAPSPQKLRRRDKLRRERERARRAKQRERALRRRERKKAQARRREARKALRQLGEPHLSPRPTQATGDTNSSRPVSQSHSSGNPPNSQRQGAAKNNQFDLEIATGQLISTASPARNRKGRGRTKPVDYLHIQGDHRTRHGGSRQESRPHSSRDASRVHIPDLHERAVDIDTSSFSAADRNRDEGTRQRPSEDVRQGVREGVRVGGSERFRRTLHFDEHDVHHMEVHENRCNHHLIDHCAWPQCNRSCPKVYHPLTGAEMDFIDLFMQFGIDTELLEGLDGAVNRDLYLSLLFNAKP